MSCVNLCVSRASEQLQLLRLLLNACVWDVKLCQVSHQETLNICGAKHEHCRCWHAESVHSSERVTCDTTLRVYLVSDCPGLSGSRKAYTHFHPTITSSAWIVFGQQCPNVRLVMLKRDGIQMQPIVVHSLKRNQGAWYLMSSRHGCLNGGMNSSSWFQPCRNHQSAQVTISPYRDASSQKSNAITLGYTQLKKTKVGRGI